MEDSGNARIATWSIDAQASLRREVVDPDAPTARRVRYTGAVRRAN